MIIRARPKFLYHKNELVSAKSKDYSRPTENSYYFNTGRASLKFILQMYGHFYKKAPRILMQSFNCSVVLDAAIEANAEILLADIDLSFFSLNYNTLKNIDTSNYDILLLTHYQGIPNFDYILIVEYCNNNNIILIEDMAQTYGSTVNDFHVGSKGDTSIYSYAFDKPFTAFKGGQICFNKTNFDFFDFLTQKYNELSVESNKEAEADLKTLSFLYKYSDEKIYAKSINNYSLIWHLSFLGLNHEKIYSICLTVDDKYLSKATSGLFKAVNRMFNKNITPKKMHPKKINIILNQKNNFFCNHSTDYLSDIAIQYGLLPVHNEHAKICWNRYSILDPDGVLKSRLQKDGLECGNYNWSTALHNLKRKYKNIKIHGTMKNSEFASKHILNIPTWHLMEHQ